MKEYCVYVDVIMAGNYYVNAENEAQAKELVRERFRKTPYEQVRRADTYVGFDITDVTEV